MKGLIVWQRNVPLRTLVASYADAIANFGPEVFHIEGYLVVSDPLNACDPIKPPPHDNTSDDPVFEPAVNYLALIKRGKCSFDSKVLNAQNQGYSGAIIFNTDESFFPMRGSNYSDAIRIPALMIDNSSGYELMKFSLSPEHPKEFLVNMISLYSLPLSYILLSLLIVVGTSLVVLVISFAVHLCRLWRRLRRGRLSRRHLRQLPIKRFVKGSDPYDTCAICLDDYVDRDKLRLLPCQHAFHMQCIDPWLLRNRRRCPVCNQTVEIPGAPSSSSASEVEESRTPREMPRTIPGILRALLARRTQSATVVPTNSIHSPLLGTEEEEENTPLLVPEIEPDGCDTREIRETLTDFDRNLRLGTSSMSQTLHDDTMLEAAGSSQPNNTLNARSVSAASLDDVIINEHTDHRATYSHPSLIECALSTNLMKESTQPLIFHEPQLENVDTQDDDPLITDVHINPVSKKSPKNHSNKN